MKDSIFGLFDSPRAGMGPHVREGVESMIFIFLYMRRNVKRNVEKHGRKDKYFKFLKFLRQRGWKDKYIGSMEACAKNQK